jgi:hypothetical protein
MTIMMIFRSRSVRSSSAAVLAFVVILHAPFESAIARRVLSDRDQSRAGGWRWHVLAGPPAFTVSFVRHEG